MQRWFLTFLFLAGYFGLAACSPRATEQPTLTGEHSTTRSAVQCGEDFNPGIEYALGANEWWVAFTYTDDAIQTLQLQIQGNETTYNMNQETWGAFAGAPGLPVIPEDDTLIRLHAFSDTGFEAEYGWFQYSPGPDNPPPLAPCDAGGPSCGDGTVDVGEDCDDGANGDNCDGCLDDCTTYTNVCGDGTQCGTEQCDDGNTTPGDGCDANCMSEEVSCVWNPGIEYALGANEWWVAFTYTDDAIQTLQLQIQGNETTYNMNHETWGAFAGAPGLPVIPEDDTLIRLHAFSDTGFEAEYGWFQYSPGPDNPPPLAPCDAGGPSCGDGVVDDGEECDDSNTNPGDGCDAACQIEGFCGDNTVDEGEDCDDGANGNNCDGCLDDCTAHTSTCGDGYTCGSETCDDGSSNGEPNQCNNSCSGNTVAVCGNSVLEAGEVCDDGANGNNCDGCLDDCSSHTNSCGDGFVCGAETCDDGSLNGQPNQCNNTCSGTTAASCGNSIVESGEACDDGNNGDPCDGCLDGCIAHTNSCGDGYTCDSEDCDDGDANDNNDCTNACALPACDDGIQNQGEARVDCGGPMCDLCVCTGDYTIDYDDTPSDIAAVEGCGIITGNLKVEDTNLSDLKVLDSLTSVGGDLEISDNSSLRNLEGLENLTDVGGDLYIFINNGLRSLAGLANLTSVGGGLTIVGCPLDNLMGLERLTGVGGDLYISNNYSLTSLTGFDSLTLTGLDSLTSVGGSFTIRSNPELPLLEAAYLAWRVDATCNCDGNKTHPPSDDRAEIVIDNAGSFDCNIGQIASLVVMLDFAKQVMEEIVVGNVGDYWPYVDGDDGGIYRRWFGDENEARKTHVKRVLKRLDDYLSGTIAVGPNDAVVTEGDARDVRIGCHDYSPDPPGGWYDFRFGLISDIYFPRFTDPNVPLISYSGDGEWVSGVPWGFDHLDHRIIDIAGKTSKVGLMIHEVLHRIDDVAPPVGDIGNWRWCLSVQADSDHSGIYNKCYWDRECRALARWRPDLAVNSNENYENFAMNVYLETKKAEAEPGCDVFFGKAQDDRDKDGIPDLCDNCPHVANAYDDDTDGDGIGDACDVCRSEELPDLACCQDDEFNDFDNDGKCGDVDVCPFEATTGVDGDGDGWCSKDNCPDTPNGDQIDTDSDGIGDACDNCPFDSNSDQEDSDGDGVGNVCDPTPFPPDPEPEPEPEPDPPCDPPCQWPYTCIYGVCEDIYR